MKLKTRVVVLTIIMLFTLALFACKLVVPEPTSIPASDTPSPSASPIPTHSKTPYPTKTSIITTIPKPTDVKPLEQVLLTDYFATPSPTFDVSQIKTATESILESCTIQGQQILFNETILHDLILTQEEKEDYLLRYLSEYGTLDKIRETLGYELHDLEKDNSMYFGDLTNDGEIDGLLRIYSVNGMAKSLYFVHCVNGEYTISELLNTGTYAGYSIITIEDLNKDGVLDIVLTMYPTMGSWNFHMYQILSWDGNKLKNQVIQPGFYSMGSMVEYQNGWIRMDGLGGRYPYEGKHFEIIDIDGNGTKEIVITGGVLSTFNTIGYGPYQSITQTYMWNGEGYVLQDMVFGAPEYRYQAVANGDIYTLLHKYEDAYTAYEMAINDPDLAWWSDETAEYIHEKETAIYGPVATPTLGAPDENEYPNLAAYAQFRLILLDVIRDDVESAEQEFASMQRSYQKGDPGYIFVEFAVKFLENYIQTKDVRSACTSAYTFGKEHEADLLRYLDIYRGYQNTEYSLENLCPFAR